MTFLVLGGYFRITARWLKPKFWLFWGVTFVLIKNQKCQYESEKLKNKWSTHTHFKKLEKQEGKKDEVPTQAKIKINTKVKKYNEVPTQTDIITINSKGFQFNIKTRFQTYFIRN